MELCRFNHLCRLIKLFLYFFFLIFFLSIHTQNLSGDIVERQVIIHELRTAAKPLIDTCDSKIVQNIQEAVNDAETAWNETNENLRDLCTKYQRAVDLWKRYREASAAVKNWADEQMGTIGTLQPLDAGQIEVSVDIDFNIFSQ